MAITLLRRLRLLAFVALGLFLAGCGSSSESRMDMDGGTDTSMEDGMDTGMEDGMDTSMEDGMDTAPDMVDLGQWDDVLEEVQPGEIWWLGFENTTHGLRVRYDPAGGPVSLTEAAATHQPTVEGTWQGYYYGFHNFTEDVYDAARIDVTIQGSNVTASVTYYGLLDAGDVISDPSPVTDGRFAISGDMMLDGASVTFAGEGQFGGTDQRGVVGHVSADNLNTAFYGNRN